MLLFILIAIIVYFALGILAYLFADKIIFQPQPSSYRDDFSVIKLSTSTSEKISARFFKNPDAKFTILFSHGNAEDIFDAETFLEELSQAGFNILAYDYRGYGTSEGRASEQKAYEDIETAYHYLVNELKILPESIILHGRSLGGAVSVYLAAKQPCGGLIVESSFVTAFRVLTKIPVFPLDKFSSILKIKQIKCPILIIHGRCDQLIPLWHAEKLLAAANEPKYSLWIANANHNDVAYIGGEKYYESIKTFSIKLTK